MAKKFLSLLLTLCMLVPCAALAAEDYTLPLAPDGAHLSFTLQENYYAGSSYADNLPVYQELEKLTGVSIDWDVVELNSFNETMEIRLASGSKLSDIIQLPNYNGADIMRYAKAGLIQPLDELIDQYAPNIKKLFFEDVPELGRTMTGYDGHIYAIPQNFYGMNFVAPFCLTLRKDWLDNLGLDVPTTLDDWYTVLKAFKEQDPNGNGLADEVPMSTQGNVSSVENAYAYLATGFGLTAPVTVQYYPDENGKVVDQYRLPEFKEYLTFLNKLYEEGLIDTAFSVDGTKLTAMAAQNLLGSTATTPTPALRCKSPRRPPAQRTRTTCASPRRSTRTATPDGRSAARSRLPLRDLQGLPGPGAGHQVDRLLLREPRRARPDALRHRGRALELERGPHPARMDGPRGQQPGRPGDLQRPAQGRRLRHAVHQPHEGIL